MPELSLSRTVRFRATHCYRIPGATEEENRRRFGEYAVPHPHDYAVEVTVRGPLVEGESFIVNLSHLDDLLQREVVARLDDCDLNEEIDEIRSGSMLPSTEALAVWFFGLLAPRLEGPARLTAVSVAESDTLTTKYEPVPPQSEGSE